MRCLTDGKNRFAGRGCGQRGPGGPACLLLPGAGLEGAHFTGTTTCLPLLTDVRVCAVLDLLAHLPALQDQAHLSYFSSISILVVVDAFVPSKISEPM